MSGRPSFAAYVELESSDGGVVYSGEAIYRPDRRDPVTALQSPTIGIPDDSMARRPREAESYAMHLSGERIPVKRLFLDRVSTCWWFVLERVPTHPPTV
jgi:hypothetical protein